MKTSFKKIILASLLFSIVLTTNCFVVKAEEETIETEQVQEERKSYQELFNFTKNKVNQVINEKEGELLLVEGVKKYQVKSLVNFVKAIPQTLEVADEADLIDLEETTNKSEVALNLYNKDLEETEQVKPSEVEYTEDKEENTLLYLEDLLDDFFAEGEEIKLIDDLDEDEAKESLDYAKALLKEVELADSDKLNAIKDKIKTLEDNFPQTEEEAKAQAEANPKNQSDKTSKSQSTSEQDKSSSSITNANTSSSPSQSTSGNVNSQTSQGQVNSGSNQEKRFSSQTGNHEAVIHGDGTATIEGTAAGEPRDFYYNETTGNLGYFQYQDTFTGEQVNELWSQDEIHIIDHTPTLSNEEIEAGYKAGQ